MSRRSADRNLARTVERVRVDVRFLHRQWMALAFPVEEVADHAVLAFRPETVPERAAVGVWSGIGRLVIAVTYLLTVLGLAVRYYARRLDRTATSLGALGVLTLSLVAWGALSAMTYLSATPFRGFVAVLTAGSVATVAAVLALGVSRVAGRRVTVAIGYPLGVTALFLPPVVAALSSPTLASVVFPGSTSLAVWILDNPLAIGGLNTVIRATFELEGLSYVAMWFVLAFPVGWVLGLLVALPRWIGRGREPVAADVAASWSGDSRS